MIVGFQFNDSLDWTAVGTLALAGVTFVSLVLGRRALAQTKEEIDVSRREVEEAHRPVVVPTKVVWGENQNPAATVAIWLENIGTGPALSLRASLELLDANGERAGHGGEPVSEGEMALRAGSEQPLRVPTRWSRGASFRVEAIYADVAGKWWRTQAKFLDDPGVLADTGRWEEVRATALDLDLPPP